MKQLSLAVLLFLLSLIGFGQDEVQRGTSAWFLQLAIDQMSQLKSGALLVRLPENELPSKRHWSAKCLSAPKQSKKSWT